jgi:hypothetical protein
MSTFSLAFSIRLCYSVQEFGRRTLKPSVVGRQNSAIARWYDEAGEARKRTTVANQQHNQNFLFVC